MEHFVYNIMDVRCRAGIVSLGVPGFKYHVGLAET
jgi:hypothetical protein